MKYTQYVYNGVKINVVEENIKALRLLQATNKKVGLSSLWYGNKRPNAIINCSYFDTQQALGRNQGDEKQDTSSWNEQKYLTFATVASGYKSGKLEFWDAPESECGFTPALICIQDGKDVQLASTGLGLQYTSKIELGTAVSFMGILSDKLTCQLITAERGIKGSTLLVWLKSKFKYDFLCELDGGGSTEMIINGSIVQKSTDAGGERAMYNGLAFVDIKEEETLYIDVSYVQKDIDYQKVKNSGIKGVIIRAGVTGYGDMQLYKDPSFDKHYEGFKNVGLPVGAYYYSCANTLEFAEKEAKFFIDILKGKQFELPVYMDVENKQRQEDLSYDILTSIVDKFVEVMGKANYYCGVYSSTSWLTKKFKSKHETWVAQYYTVNQYAGEYGLWQFTSTGQVSGISGNVDMSRVYKDFSFIKEQGFNGFGPEPQPDPEYEKIIAELQEQNKKLEEDIKKKDEYIASLEAQIKNRDEYILYLQKKLDEIKEQANYDPIN